MSYYSVTISFSTYVCLHNSAHKKYLFHKKNMYNKSVFCILEQTALTLALLVEKHFKAPIPQMLK